MQSGNEEVMEGEHDCQDQSMSLGRRERQERKWVGGSRKGSRRDDGGNEGGDEAKTIMCLNTTTKLDKN